MIPAKRLCTPSYRHIFTAAASSTTTTLVGEHDTSVVYGFVSLRIGET
jgi:hypothetical protein